LDRLTGSNGGEDERCYASENLSWRRRGRVTSIASVKYTGEKKPEGSSSGPYSFLLVKVSLLTVEGEMDYRGRYKPAWSLQFTTLSDWRVGVQPHPLGELAEERDLLLFLEGIPRRKRRGFSSPQSRDR